MNDTDAYAIFSDTVWVILIASGPVLALATAVGLVIALLQALTQVQEMTLTFVPKIVAIGLGLVAAMPFTYGTLERLSDRVFEIISSGAL